MVWAAGAAFSFYSDTPCCRADTRLVQVVHVQFDQIRRRNNVIVAVEEIAASGHFRAHVSGMGQIGSGDEMPANTMWVPVLASADELLCPCFVVRRLVDDQEFVVGIGKSEQILNRLTQDFLASIGGNNNRPEGTVRHCLFAYKELNETLIGRRQTLGQVLAQPAQQLLI